jgi:hypothetical protein
LDQTWLVGRKDDDRVAQRPAILGGPERHDVDPGSPSRIGWAAPEPRHGIGKPGTIHVEPETAPLGGLGNRPDLVEAIHRSEIGRLGQADRARLASVKLRGRDPGQRLGQQYGVDFAVLPADRSQLEAAAEEPRSVGFGSVDVCGFAAIDDAPGRAERGKGDGIGGGPGGDRKNPHGGLEQV